jgi:hypothetical protein
MTVVRDVKVKLRMHVLFVEQEERGSEKAGKDAKSGQRQIIESMPEITIDYDELQRRISDAAIVLHEGWELDNDGPPAVSTEGVTALTKNSVTLHARVSTHAQSTCGFMVDTKRDVDAASHNADESPVAANLDDVTISHNIAGLTPGTKYYYRPWANTAGLYTRYGNVRSFTTPLV